MVQSSFFAIVLLKDIFPNYVKNIVINSDSVVVYIDKDGLLHILNFLKYSSLLQYKQLLDVCGVDYPDRSERFELLYNLLSVSFQSRLYLKLRVHANVPLMSATDVYHSAGWLEREVWDMYGVFFSNHTDLRRILTDYGFDGFPLRKDFPLTGYSEVRYDDTVKKIVTEPVEVSQEFRYFDFVTPWDWHNKQ